MPLPRVHITLDGSRTEVRVDGVTIPTTDVAVKASIYDVPLVTLTVPAQVTIEGAARVERSDAVGATCPYCAKPNALIPVGASAVCYFCGRPTKAA